MPRPQTLAKIRNRSDRRRHHHSLDLWSVVRHALQDLRGAVDCWQKHFLLDIFKVVEEGGGEVNNAVDSLDGGVEGPWCGDVGYDHCFDHVTVVVVGGEHLLARGAAAGEADAVAMAEEVVDGVGADVA